jgi:hypothetical protein
MKAIRRTLGVLVGGWLGLSGGVARSANDDGIPVGIEAAQTAAAVTAVVSGGAAAFYNPAGLANDASSSIDASLSAYGLRFFSAESVLSGPEGETEPARVVDWVLVPSMVAYVRELKPRLNGSFGIYVPQTQDYLLQARLKTNEGTEWTAVQREAGNAYYAGFGIGYELLPNLRVGGSLLGVYATDNSSVALAGGAKSDSRVHAVGITLSSIESSREYGVTARCGLQWDVLPELVLGLTVYAPSVTLLRVLDQASLLATVGVGDMDAVIIDDQGERSLSGDVGGAPGVRMGGAYRYARGWAALDATLNLPLQGDDASTTRELSWNLRAGGVYKFNETYEIGGGLFTDRNPVKAHGLDYYGFTGGVIHTHVYELKDGGALRLITGLSIRYAYGSGEIFGNNVPPLSDRNNPVFDSVTFDARGHELGANIGSSISF